MSPNRVIVWFRNDLRIADNETLIKAIQSGKEIVPVYCFDLRMWAKTALGLTKTGAIRTKFLIESIRNLRESFQKLGGNLIILQGKPEEEVIKLAEKLKVGAIFYSQEVTSEEKTVDKSLESAAFAKGISTESFWQSTLYHIDDLPFPVSQTPEVFTHFRKAVEKLVKIRPTGSTPSKINFPSDLDPSLLGSLPSLQTYGLEKPARDVKSWMEVEGGEHSGIGRLRSYFWEKDLLKDYKETRNGLIGMDYSSKFSPWLALGCISPRLIYEEVKRYEKERKKNDSTYWLIFELIWRDYFRFIAKKHGDKIFNIRGIKNQEDSWSRDKSQFEAWTEGMTGVPFVDANMRELNATGFMSNRGRQIVASFLVNDLGIDWTWGASYFESQLIDYDVCSNWGNWMYVGGVGNDPRENRYFNVLRQAKNYDRNGDYIRLMIPELQAIKGFDIHQPWDLSTSQLRSLKIQLGHTYPHALRKIPTLEKA
ncbi:DASH family cryptochrome [Algoriphagus boritolerans]|uniref:Cryptochrome DASH n=1 Tax=Algoriphagus boritolerans DSM 17298 = JCM 18970 TaxID=1120964 RepID=A0A1H5YCR8_9BACT|nr:DASH family cryptochrome [Algoriphagus boritolerans]SEG21417.1 deoxyribodipyrimidine photo-lyase [Algoriphagus boritolerans DSM 17298 = JCM 18970]